MPACCKQTGHHDRQRVPRRVLPYLRLVRCVRLPLLDEVWSCHDGVHSRKFASQGLSLVALQIHTHCKLVQVTGIVSCTTTDQAKRDSKQSACGCRQNTKSLCLDIFETALAVHWLTECGKHQE